MQKSSTLALILRRLKTPRGVIALLEGAKIANEITDRMKCGWHITNCCLISAQCQCHKGEKCLREEWFIDFVCYTLTHHQATHYIDTVVDHVRRRRLTYKL